MLTTPKKSARLLPVNCETTKTADVIYHQKQNQFIVKAVVDQMHNNKWAAVCRLFLHLTQVTASRLHHQTAQPGIRTSKLQCFLIRHQWWILCFFFSCFSPHWKISWQYNYESHEKFRNIFDFWKAITCFTSENWDDWFSEQHHWANRRYKRWDDRDLSTLNRHYNNL